MNKVLRDYQNIKFRIKKKNTRQMLKKTSEITKNRNTRKTKRSFLSLECRF